MEDMLLTAKGLTACRRPVVDARDGQAHQWRDEDRAARLQYRDRRARAGQAQNSAATPGIIRNDGELFVGFVQVC